MFRRDGAITVFHVHNLRTPHFLASARGRHARRPRTHSTPNRTPRLRDPSLAQVEALTKTTGSRSWIPKADRKSTARTVSTQLDQWVEGEELATALSTPPDSNPLFTSPRRTRLQHPDLRSDIVRSSHLRSSVLQATAMAFDEGRISRDASTSPPASEMLQQDLQPIRLRPARVLSSVVTVRAQGATLDTDHLRDPVLFTVNTNDLKGVDYDSTDTPSVYEHSTSYAKRYLRNRWSPWGRQHYGPTLHHVALGVAAGELAEQHGVGSSAADSTTVYHEKAAESTPPESSSGPNVLTRIASLGFHPAGEDIFVRERERALATADAQGASFERRGSLVGRIAGRNSGAAIEISRHRIDDHGSKFQRPAGLANVAVASDDAGTARSESTLCSDADLDADPFDEPHVQDLSRVAPLGAGPRRSRSKRLAKWHEPLHIASAVRSVYDAHATIARLGALLPPRTISNLPTIHHGLNTDVVHTRSIAAAIVAESVNESPLPVSSPPVVTGSAGLTVPLKGVICPALLGPDLGFGWSAVRLSLDISHLASSGYIHDVTPSAGSIEPAELRSSTGADLFSELVCRDLKCGPFTATKPLQLLPPMPLPLRSLAIDGVPSEVQKLWAGDLSVAWKRLVSSCDWLREYLPDKFNPIAGMACFNPSVGLLPVFENVAPCNLTRWHQAATLPDLCSIAWCPSDGSIWLLARAGAGLVSRILVDACLQRAVEMTDKGTLHGYDNPLLAPFPIGTRDCESVIDLVEWTIAFGKACRSHLLRCAYHALVSRLEPGLLPDTHLVTHDFDMPLCSLSLEETSFAGSTTLAMIHRAGACQMNASMSRPRRLPGLPGGSTSPVLVRPYSDSSSPFHTTLVSAYAHTVPPAIMDFMSHWTGESNEATVNRALLDAAAAICPESLSFIKGHRTAALSLYTASAFGTVAPSRHVKSILVPLVCTAMQGQPVV